MWNEGNMTFDRKYVCPIQHRGFLHLSCPTLVGWKFEDAEFVDLSRDCITTVFALYIRKIHEKQNTTQIEIQQ